MFVIHRKLQQSHLQIYGGTRLASVGTMFQLILGGMLQGGIRGVSRSRCFKRARCTGQQCIIPARPNMLEVSIGGDMVAGRTNEPVIRQRQYWMA